MNSESFGKLKMCIRTELIISSIVVLLTSTLLLAMLAVLVMIVREFLDKFDQCLTVRRLLPLLAIKTLFLSLVLVSIEP